MSKLPLILSLSGVAVLAGCATAHKVAPAPAPVVVQPAPTTPPTAAVGDRVAITSDGYMRRPKP